MDTQAWVYSTTVQTSCKLEGSRVAYALGTRFAGVPFRSFREAHDNARVANEKQTIRTIQSFSSFLQPKLAHVHVHRICISLKTAAKAITSTKVVSMDIMCACVYVHVHVP